MTCGHSWMERKWPGVRSCIFFYILWTARCVRCASWERRWHQGALWDKGELGETVWGWETLYSAIPVDATTENKPTQEAEFPLTSGLYQQGNTPCKVVQERFQENKFKVLTWPQSSLDPGPVKHLRVVLDQHEGFKTWEKNRNLHNNRQVVIMLWLIGACSCMAHCI